MAASSRLGHIAVINAALTFRPDRGGPRTAPGIWARHLPQAPSLAHGAELRYRTWLDRVDPYLDRGFGNGAMPLPSAGGTAFDSPFVTNAHAFQRCHVPHSALRSKVPLSHVLRRAVSAAIVTWVVWAPLFYVLGGWRLVVCCGYEAMTLALGLALFLRMVGTTSVVSRVAQEAAGAMALGARLALAVGAMAHAGVVAAMHSAQRLWRNHTTMAHDD